MNEVSRRRILLGLGVAQTLLGAWFLVLRYRQPIRDTYVLWDRVSELIVSGAIDLQKFDAQMVAQGRRPSGLNAETVRADPGSRPGGFSVISDYLLPGEELVGVVP